MKAIRVRFVPATNTKPSRVTACDADRHSITVSRDSFDSFEDAANRAVELLCEKMDWPGEKISGGFGEDLYYVFTPKRESFPRGDMMREAMKRSTFIDAYVEALFFTESGDDNLKEAGVDDMSFDIVTRIIRDCNVFETAHAVEIENGAGSSQAGHDFWLTRNGHGAGFWEKSDWDSLDGERMTATCKAFGEMSVYIGDDGLIYQLRLVGYCIQRNSNRQSLCRRDAMEYIEFGQACVSCVMAISNGEYSQLDAATKAAVKAGIAEIPGLPVIGEEIGFSWRGCDVCKSQLGGDFHSVGYLASEVGE